MPIKQFEFEFELEQDRERESLFVIWTSETVGGWERLNLFVTADRGDRKTEQRRREEMEQAWIISGAETEETCWKQPELSPVSCWGEEMWFCYHSDPWENHFCLRGNDTWASLSIPTVGCSLCSVMNLLLKDYLQSSQERVLNKI